ncbi:MAG: hypothetical protein OHK0011_00770 [Turneriella sp.]
MKNRALIQSMTVLAIKILFASGGILFVAGCLTRTNEAELRTQNVVYYLGYGGNPQAKAKLLQIIKEAQSEIVGVFNDLADTDVSAALIARANAGLKVAIGGDRRNENSAGFAALKALRPQNKFLDYFAATSAAANETNPAAKDRILATRLNFNRLKHPTKLRYDASAFDGRVEYNFVVADKYNCWVSTGGANSETFQSGISVVLVFQSFDICNDFYNEAQQPAIGGLFGDEGEPSFGKFRNNKSINDPNTRFRLGDLIFNIYFAPQERPLVPVVTELMRAENSIRFAARALTHDVIQNVADESQNRSHIRNVLEAKARIPQHFGGTFSVSGVLGNETDPAPTDIGTPWTPYTAKYDELMTGSCPTVNSTTVNLPFLDTNNAPLTNSVANRTSIHCDLNVLQNLINDPAVASFRKYATRIPFSVFLIDAGTRKPRIIVMSSDLRKRYYYDPGNSQDAEPLRTQNDFYPITDAFVMIIEPAGSQSDMRIFDDFGEFVSRLFNAGGSL